MVAAIPNGAEAFTYFTIPKTSGLTSCSPFPHPPPQELSGATRNPTRRGEENLHLCSMWFSPLSFPSHSTDKRFHLSSPPPPPCPTPCRIVLCYEVSNFSMQPRYDLYFSLGEVARYWAVPNPPSGFLEATEVFNNVMYLSQLYGIYFAIQGLK